MTRLLDVESRSRADLTVVGGRNYWEAPSTEALCVVHYDTESREYGLWLPGDPCPLRPGEEWAAHNAIGFDRFALNRLGWRALDDAPERVIDTSELARTAGLPGALDALGARWLGLRKDKAASKFTKGLSSCRRPSGKHNPAAIAPEFWRALSPIDKRRLGVQPELTREALERVVTYCFSDVEIMVHGWPLLESWRDLEPDVVRVARRINDRGIGFDVQLAKRLLEEDARNQGRELERIARELGDDWTPERVRDVANSPAQFAEWTGAENAQAATIDAILADQTLEWSEGARLLAQARRAIASIARGKLEAGLALVSPDGRLRDTHKYYGAHTGRCSGKGMQLHNMPRPAKRFEKWGDAEVCALAGSVLGGAHADQDEIDLLVRACLAARPGHTFATCDFSGVEGRATAWCSGDKQALDTIASGRDSYIINAAMLFGVRYEDIQKGDPRRQGGKVMDLSCGYQGGHRAFEKMARQQGINLEALGINSKKAVEAWRKLHPAIVKAWADCEAAFLAAARGETAQWSLFTFTPSDDGQDVAIFMPSGRPLVYPKVQIGNGKYGKPSLSYEGHKDARPIDPQTGERYGEPLPMREHVYGGLVLENVIQSMCRDLMAPAMVRADDAGLCVELEVYDELVCEVPESAAQEAFDYLHATMVDVPEWAEGFPAAAAGHLGRRYRK